MRMRLGLVMGLLVALAVPASAGEAKDGEKPMRPSNSVETNPHRKVTGWEEIPLPPAAQKGIKWLVMGQNPDGGWGMHGKRGTTKGTPHWEQNGSDLGNTALAAMAILATGSTPEGGTFQGPLKRAVEYVLRIVEPIAKQPLHKAPTTPRQGRGRSQLEGKIGRYAPVFLSARFLMDVDGKMPTGRENDRVHAALEKLVTRIVEAQSPDGSWNATGGWAPIHSTAYASKTLWAAKARGFKVPDKVFERVNAYTVRAVSGHVKQGGTPPTTRRKRPRRSGPVTTPGSGSTPSGPVSSGAAGVHLYSIGQGIEQLTRTPADRKQHAKLIHDMARKAGSEATLKGLGTMGGEEFISYHNINLAMARIGGREALYWNVKMKRRMADLQNSDGSWSGHHCITGRTACTSTAIMTLVAERSVPRTR